MNRKKLVMIPTIGVSLMVLSVFAVGMLGYIPYEGTSHGLLVEGSADKMAAKADLAVTGTIGDSRTYLTYFYVGELLFPKVYTMTEMEVTEVLRGDENISGDVITIRTVGGTYNKVTTDFEPVPKFNKNEKVLVYLDDPIKDAVQGTYYPSQGIQSTFNLDENGKYVQQWNKTILDAEQVRTLLAANQ